MSEEPTIAEQAAMDRVLAGVREFVVAREMLFVEIDQAAGAFRNFMDAWVVSEFASTIDADEEIHSHPDIVAMDQDLDEWFDAP